MVPHETELVSKKKSKYHGKERVLHDNNDTKQTLV